MHSVVDVPLATSDEEIDELTLIRLFFDDIERQPAIISRRQQLWLGAQINGVRSLERWRQSFRKENDRFPTTQEMLRWIYSELTECWAGLNDHTMHADIRLPGLEGLASEVLIARHNLFKLRRSRVRRMFNQVEHADSDAFVSLAYDLVETLWMIPDSALRYLGDWIGENETLPIAEDFDEWIAIQSCLDREFEQVLAQKRKSRRWLIAGFLRYPAKMARNYVDRGVEYLDLVQEGVLGVMRAARRYDYRKHGKFANYVSTWIWQSIGRAIPNYGRSIRIPVHFYEKLQEVQDAYYRTASEGISEPSAHQIALRSELLSLDELEPIKRSQQHGSELAEEIREKWDNAAAEIQLALSHLWTIHSICEPLPDHLTGGLPHAPSDDHGHICLSTLIPADPSAMPPENIKHSDLSDRILQVLESLDLSDRNRRMIELRYGLKDGQERTLEEVGEKFGLTRERVRQIEAKVLERMAHPVHRKPLINYHRDEQTEINKLRVPRSILSHLEQRDHDKLFRTLAPFEESDDSMSVLDDWLADLPGGRQFGHKIDSGKREEQLSSVFTVFGSPTHYTDIAEELNEQLVDGDLMSNYVYSLLTKYDDTFILLGQGVFSFIEWELSRAEENEPVIPYCPSPLGGSGSFFESVFVAKELLEETLPVNEFLAQILEWAGSDVNQLDWLCQSYLTAYYLVGIVPYVFFPDSNERSLYCTLPEGNVHETRYFCLQKLNQRLVAMPGFWWYLHRHQPLRVTHLGELFVDAHPAGLYDAGNRLDILESLGAVLNEYGHYRLTSLGEELAGMWAKRPEMTDVVDTIEEEGAHTIDEWAELGLLF